MSKKKQWKDFSTAAKIRLFLLGIVQLMLLGAALWDIRHRPAEQINGSKKLWYGVVFVNYVGPIAYFLFGRKSGQGVRAT